MAEEPYDCIIIGAGIAGLYTAVELLREVPKLRLAVYEKERDIGGRVYTFHQEVDGVKLQWEAGAGRISERHYMVLDLLKRYKLKFVSIGGDIQYKDTYKSALEADAFENGVPVFMDPLMGLPADVLGRSTIRQLLTKIHGPAKTEEYLIRFPYRAEVDVMRADMALQLFAHEFRRTEKYGICAEGLSALTAALQADAEKRGASFFMEKELLEVSQDGLVEARFRKAPQALEDVTLVKKSSERSEDGLVHARFRGDETVKAKHCVLALPVEALRRLKPLASWSGLKRLTMTPLLRFYGSFPKGPDDKLWYEAYGGRIVTSTPIRYMIPGRADIGSAHMSYTDTQDARYWIDKLNAVGEKKVGEEMLAELRKLLSPEIPPPNFVKAHAWDYGVTYWLPGDYEPATISREALRPLPDMPAVHLCGESFSTRQGWMEGALEHAAKLVPKLVRNME
jgi:monoamine oxidase